MNSGGSAPADMGGEPPDGRATELEGFEARGVNIPFTFTLDQ